MKFSESSLWDMEQLLTFWIIAWLLDWDWSRFHGWELHWPCWYFIGMFNSWTILVDYLHKAQVEEIVCVCFFFQWVQLMLLCVFLGPIRYIFHTSMAWYSLFVLKVPLNAKQTDMFNSFWGSVLVICSVECWGCFGFSRGVQCMEYTSSSAVFSSFDVLVLVTFPLAYCWMLHMGNTAGIQSSLHNQCRRSARLRAVWNCVWRSVGDCFNSWSQFCGRYFRWFSRYRQTASCWLWTVLPKS